MLGASAVLLGLVLAGCGAEDAVDRSGAAVAVVAEGCGTPSRGVGVAMGGDVVLTNAHVVAGADAVAVEGAAGTVVGFDPNRDLALVVVPGLDGRPLDTADAGQGDVGTLAAIDVDEGIVLVPYEVERRIRATGDDIYGDDGADRQALQVDAALEQGWSGAGLFDDAGRLVGLAFAESTSGSGPAYAVAAEEIEAFLLTSDHAVDASEAAAVDVGLCL